MKKLVAGLLAAVALLFIPAAAALAAPSPDFTVISGTVTNNGKDVNNAKVTVICNNHALKATSDSTGYYTVAFTASQCKPGSVAYVTATKGSKGGVDNGKVNQNSADLNVAIVNVALPELGLLTGVGAAVFGGVAFMLVRRRDLGANSQE